MPGRIVIETNPEGDGAIVTVYTPATSLAARGAVTERFWTDDYGTAYRECSTRALYITEPTLATLIESAVAIYYGYDR